jgi:Ca2+-binding RTX toxin-like protein
MQVTATFNDPTGRYTAQADLMIRNAVAAFAMWQPFLADSEGSIEIDFHLVTNYANRGGGASVINTTVGVSGGLTVAMPGAAYEILTGRDPNGSAPDIDVFFDVDFLTTYYWVNPLNGAAVPSNKSDLVEVIAHEIGHALGFIGYRDWDTGQLTGGFATPFDTLVSAIGGTPYFTGAQAQALYGAAVPLTTGNLFHVGRPTGVGAELVSDLMNGVSFVLGADYAVSALDVAMLSDLGIPTVLNDRLVGTSVSDAIHGGGGNDNISAGDGDDKLFGEAGDDVLVGGAGADIIDGGAGADIVVFSGRIGDYTSTVASSGYRIVVDTRAGSPDGTDSLINVETLRFADGDLVIGGTKVELVKTLMANILRTTAPTGVDLQLQDALIGLLTVGQITEAQAVGQVVLKAAATTSVATLAYEFFTGKIPSAAGIDFLVSPTGANANNLNSAYYQSFNLENRYINFSVNLGKLGEGQAKFAAEYGALSLFDATRKAYTTIFGAAPTDEKAHALLDPRADYFAAYGQDGPNGQGTKAAMVGWLLAEAVKADIGTYAKSNDAFLIDLADGATFAVDLVGVYGKPEYAYTG